jgi:predicted nucleotidyltransferase
MEEELAKIFGRPVDLCERPGVERSRNRYRKASILSSAVMLDVA